MGTIKDAADLLRELSFVRRLLAERDAKEELRKILVSFSPELAKGDKDDNSTFDYFRWNDEADRWSPEDGEVVGTSFGEIERLWTDQGFYTTYEAGLVRFIRAGGVIHRTIVVGADDFVNPARLLLLIKTGLRQTILGIPPRIAYHSEISGIMRELSVDAQMVGVQGNHTAYFMRIHPRPIAVKTTAQRFVSKAWKCYHALAARSVNFDKWLGATSFDIDYDIAIKDAEVEARGILVYADGPAAGQRLPSAEGRILPR